MARWIVGGCTLVATLAAGCSAHVSMFGHDVVRAEVPGRAAPNPETAKPEITPEGIERAYKAVKANIEAALAARADLQRLVDQGLVDEEYLEHNRKLLDELYVQRDRLARLLPPDHPEHPGRAG